MCRPPKVVRTFHVPSTKSSRHIPCAVHLESWQKFDCGQHDGACLLLLSYVFLGRRLNKQAGSQQTMEQYRVLTLIPRQSPVLLIP